MIQVEKSYLTFKNVPSYFAPVRFWGSWFLLLSLLWLSGWFRKVSLPLWMFLLLEHEKILEQICYQGPLQYFQKMRGRVRARISALCPHCPYVKTWRRHVTGLGGKSLWSHPTDLGFHLLSCWCACNLWKRQLSHLQYQAYWQDAFVYRYTDESRPASPLNAGWYFYYGLI